MTPMNGTMMNIPNTPAIVDPAGIASRTTAGWMLTALAGDERRDEVALDDVEHEGEHQHDRRCPPGCPRRP